MNEGLLTFLIVLGVVVVIALVTFLLYLYLKPRLKRDDKPSEDQILDEEMKRERNAKRATSLHPCEARLHKRANASDFMREARFLKPVKVRFRAFFCGFSHGFHIRAVKWSRKPRGGDPYGPDLICGR